MLLKNAKVCKNMLKLMGQNSSNTSHDISFLGGIKKADGTYINTVYDLGIYSHMCSPSNRYLDYVLPVPQSFSPLGVNTVSGNATFNIQLGSGNTTPTENDYKLVSTYNLTTNFLPLTKSGSITIKGDNSGVIFNIKQHFLAVTALTISEIGLSNAVAANNSASGFQHVLLTRDVLDTPLEVSAGQGFTLKISVEQPFSEI